MLKVNLNTQDFNINNYSKIQLVKEYKNGSKDYKALCTCPRCGGRGFINFSSVDNSRCWQCNETGKVIELIHVGESVKKQLTKEEVLENIRRIEKENENYYLGLGYKLVDFTLAKWLKDVWFNYDSYYRIIKETEKAYLMGRVDNLKESKSEMTFWVPKTAIIFN